jgi:pyruvyl transferase EpsO
MGNKMKQDNWLSCMESLKECHAEIAQLLTGKSVAFIDIPTYFNVGDLLIYKGTEAFFEQFNVNISYRCGTAGIDYNQLEKVDVILMQGGGNFGDLYQVHQKLRESIISKFIGKKIICLPQSIHFESEKALVKSAALFSQHPDFHFYVRDNASFSIAKRFTSNVSMMPDMAHSLHPLVDLTEVGISNASPPRILNLVRIDKEGSKNMCTVNKLGFDWVNIIMPHDRLILRLYYKMLIVPFLRGKAIRLWSKHCDEIIFRSVNYFLSHTQVHTDRLHGLILAALLGKEIYLKDNSYGKNTRYHQAWLKEYPYLDIAPKQL